LELALGLGAVAAAVAFTTFADAPTWIASPLLALGGYLALAGHRTHIYDAMTRQTAVLREEGVPAASEASSTAATATAASARERQERDP
jgi:hypothetical protein